MNRLLQGKAVVADPEVKRMAAQKIANAMEALLSDGNPTATDYSRLAWLYLYRGEKEKARAHVESGLELEPDNEYCLNLRDNRLR
jgi:tetratricopeptide (TPR) repeat protein